MPDLPIIAETGDRMVFLVRSDRNPRVAYRVDLLAHNGAGGCACTDFATRRKPNLDAGKSPWTKASACKHIIRAGLHVLRTTLPEMAAQEDRPSNRKHRNA